jgi:glycerate dehydrogenase
MTLVVLDGHTLNPGDLSWGPLQTLGECRIYERTASDEVVPRAREAEIVLTNKTVIQDQHLGQLPKVKYIGVLATGTNVVDLAAAQSRGIPVTNVPAYGTRSVAQTTVALLLELTQNVGHHARTVRDGGWSHAPDWCYWDFPLVELDGLTVGIIGLGRIGRAVAAILSAMGMHVLAVSRNAAAVPSFIRVAALETLFRQSDVVSLHCPLTDQTARLVNAQRLAWMKPTAFLINTSRGGLIDEPALAEALNSGRLAGAGLDVLSTEPPKPDNPLLHARNCVVTPHLAWGTRAARARLLQIAVDNIRSFLAGQPQNVVN